MSVHCTALWKIGDHPLHQLAKARVRQRFVVHDNEERSHQVAHALHVPDLQVAPHVTEPPIRISKPPIKRVINKLRAHDVAQLVQIGGSEVVVVAVASLHVLVDPVQIEAVRFEELRL